MHTHVVADAAKAFTNASVQIGASRPAAATCDAPTTNPWQRHHCITCASITSARGQFAVKLRHGTSSHRRFRYSKWRQPSPMVVGHKRHERHQLCGNKLTPPPSAKYLCPRERAALRTPSHTKHVLLYSSPQPSSGALLCLCTCLLPPPPPHTHTSTC